MPAESSQNKFVANGGWVERKCPRKSDAWLCLGSSLVLAVTSVAFGFWGGAEFWWFALALVPFVFALGGIAVRLFRAESSGKSVLIPNPDTDLRKLY